MRRRLAAVLSLSIAFSLQAEVLAPVDAPYAPGPVRIEVDASNLAQRIVRVRQTIPAQPGALTLLYPQWLPGNHAPRGPIDKLAGLQFSANGRKLEWRRDPRNVYAFHLDVPSDAQSVVAQYDYLTPTDRAQGRVVMAPAMLNLQWNAVVLYPAGHHASRIQSLPSMKVPSGWHVATALDGASRDGDTVTYAGVPLDILVDSPVFAGRHFRQVDLAPGAKVPIRLNVFADHAKQLEAKPEHLALHRAMVEQALKLFGTQHYDHYDFLLALSGQMSGIGLEHQRSSENGVPGGYFIDWDEKTGSTDLLAHEFVHSWNGKYRRPADLWVADYSQPMGDSLLWVYEGQTQFWGSVLNARSGLRPKQAARDALALVAATYAENRPGQSWRSIQDTTLDPIISARGPKPYRSQQMSEDYYSGGMLIWLEADTLIREKTGDRKSMDDFARAFFGGGDGVWRTQDTYTFQDVVATLDGVAAHDWTRFLRERLDGKRPLTGGIEASGWKLVYKDEPSAYAKARAWSADGAADFVHSIGLSLDKAGQVTDVRWDSPAFDAGLGSGSTVVAVDGREYAREALEDAIRAAKETRAPISLLVKEFDRYRTVAIDYHGGLRHPHLERIAGTPDRLGKLFAPR
ncbi:MAG: peptidase M61 [Pseudomonadota bacterium]|nr:peptidase M61 [Pseudomonadota bacterium]